MAALEMLGPSEEVRSALIERYVDCALEPIKLDSSCSLRTVLLKALTPMALPDDTPLLEAAAATVQLMPPGAKDAAHGLRAAALIALERADERLGALHAVRLLTDAEGASAMSGEPALTAVRVLAAQGHQLVLYAHLVRRQPGPGEVVAECFRSLASLPCPILGPLLEDYRDSPDDLATLGVIDLVLAHPERGSLAGFLAGFLVTTSSLDLYRYAATGVVAARSPELVEVLRNRQAVERDARKKSILIDAPRLA